MVVLVTRSIYNPRFFNGLLILFSNCFRLNYARCQFCTHLLYQCKHLIKIKNNCAWYTKLALNQSIPESIKKINFLLQNQSTTGKLQPEEKELVQTTINQSGLSY